MECDPGEGFRSIDRPEPLTPTLSRKGRGGSPSLARHRANQTPINYQFRTRAPGLTPNTGIWLTASTTAKVMISIEMPSTEIAARSPLSLRS
jgi:hypothetical protein